MTVRFLSNADKVRLKRAAERELKLKRQEEYKRQFGTKKLSDLSKTNGDYDEAVDILNNYDPFDNPYYDENPDLEDFPACCGADIMCGFEYQDGNNGKLSAHEKQYWSLKVDELLRDSKKLTVAILNDHQQAVFKTVFESFGGECHGKTAKGNYGNDLYLWIFIKNAPRKKKRVF